MSRVFIQPHSPPQPLNYTRNSDNGPDNRKRGSKPVFTLGGGQPAGRLRDNQVHQLHRTRCGVQQIKNKGYFKANAGPNKLQHCNKACTGRALTLSFIHSTVRESFKILIQVFDQRKFKRNDGGFLGFVSITVGGVLNINEGGSGMPPILLIRMYHPGLQLWNDGQKSYTEISCSRSHRRPRFPSWPNNSILLGPSTICAYPLHGLPQGVPATHY